MKVGCELITLVGEIDMTRLDELRAAVESFRTSELAHVAVEMTEVTFCGSEGMGLIARLLSTAQERGGTVTLVNANRQVQSLLEICGLLDAVTLSADSRSNQKTGSRSTALRND